MLPLINIVLLLMIFFMLLGAIAPAMPIELEPVASLTLERADASSAGLMIGRNLEMSFGGQVFARSELAQQARRWHRAHPRGELQLKTDARADASEVMQALQILRSAGIEKINLLAADAAR